VLRNAFQNPQPSGEFFGFRDQKIYISSFHKDRGAEEVGDAVDMSGRYDQKEQDRLAQAVGTKECSREGIKLARDWSAPLLYC
jgi:hypothetical protein